MSFNKIIIIGAGPSGLTLAQTLRRHGIPYEIYERDTSSTSRPQGWGLSLQSVMEYLSRGLVPELFSKIGQVAVNTHDPTSYYVLMDGVTGEKLNHDRGNSYRVNRGRFRSFLSEGVDVQWGKKFTKYHVHDKGVTVYFEDGTEVEGDVVVGADGIHSLVSEQAHGPGGCVPVVVPVAMLMTSLTVKEEVYKILRKVISTHGRAIGPSRGQDKGVTCAFISVVDVRLEKDEYDLFYAQSWVILSKEDEIPESNEDKLRLFKKQAEGFCEPWRSLMINVPEDVIMEIFVVCEKYPKKWNDEGGRVVLIGDAAKAMTMFRGEGGNHAMKDAVILAEELRHVHEGNVSLNTAVENYEKELITRAQKAIQESHEAVFTLHKVSQIV